MVERKINTFVLPLHGTEYKRMTLGMNLERTRANILEFSADWFSKSYSDHFPNIHYRLFVFSYLLLEYYSFLVDAN